jgi:membrane peptidoglycan carboxypeptidase
MYDAIARSSNTYFSHIADRLGPEVVVETAKRMGVSADLIGYCSSVLGTEEVYGLDMASAYGTLANNGVRCTPYAIKQVTDSRGRRLLKNYPSCMRVIEPGIAARATDMLRGPIEAGTAYTNGQIGRPAAGKTGTTDDYGDAWFIGFVPQLSAASWVGHLKATEPLTDSRCGSGYVTGGCLPTMIWADFMRQATRSMPVRDFPDPPALEYELVPDVVRQQVDIARRIVDANFTVITDRVVHGAPAGTVVEQQPRAGELQEAGAEVVLSISDGTGPPLVAPTLVGLTREEANQLLQELGIIAEAFNVPVRNPDLVGRIVGQEPAAGAPLEVGERMTVEIGEPAPPPPPRRRGRPPRTEPEAAEPQA